MSRMRRAGIAALGMAGLGMATMGAGLSNPRPEGFVAPELSGLAATGAPLFAANCAVCHGPSGVGTNQGPPLIHRIYEPSHHGDFAFVAAIRRGSRAHHWQFGDMPPVPGVSDDEAMAIIAYVRAAQAANGIR